MWPFKKKAVLQTKKQEGFFNVDPETVLFQKRERVLPPLKLAKASLGNENGLPIEETGMYDSNGFSTIKPNYYNNGGIPDSVLFWYAAQNFIGYQVCALLSQHWLVDKACSMPGRDAVRNGYEITVNDGTDVDTKILDKLREFDKAYKIKKQMSEFVRKGRIFGIRIALFVVESNDPDYYAKPFNIDGIEPGTYKGISQIDPYWVTPQLTNTNVSDPKDPNFYEPTFWQIGNILIHRSHLCIFTTGEVADILKPSYSYGGVSIPQRIYERVYAAERTANEAPMLAMTKRLTVINADVATALTDPVAFQEKMQAWADIRDNYGLKVAGLEEKITMTDTALGDMDNLIMTQYQLVAAIAEVPGTKLLGTQPKGFNSTGEFEESSYHESLESLQENDLSPMLEKHHSLVIKSDIQPLFDISFSVTAVWKPLDAMTAQEQAQLNLLKAQVDAELVAIGAIDGMDSRERVTSDPDSGYNGLKVQAPKLPGLATGGSGGAAGAAGGGDPDAAPGDASGALPKPVRPTAPHIAPTPGA
jgi:phage-related protein (TIGR01555 family)